jgi:hypothetical protein
MEVIVVVLAITMLVFAPREPAVPGAGKVRLAGDPPPIVPPLRVSAVVEV